MGQEDRSSTQSAPFPHEGKCDSLSRTMISEASGGYTAKSGNERDMSHQVVRRLSAPRWHIGPNDLQIHDPYSLCGHHTIEAQ